MSPILDNKERARRSILFFYLLLGHNVTGHLYSLVQEKVYNLGSISIADYQISYDFVCTTLLLYVSYLLQISVIIGFLLWFSRAYQNLERAGCRRKYSTRFAIASWFIPFINFVTPYQIAKEIWYKTQKAYTRNIQKPGLVNAWWIAFLFALFVFKILDFGFRVILLNHRLELSDYPLWILFRAAIRIVAIVLTILFIKKVASFEELLRIRLTANTVGQKRIATEEKDIEEEFY